VTRADYIAAIGRTTRPPTEAEWEELEAELAPLRKDTDPGATHREVVDHPFRQLITVAWKRRHGLEPTKGPELPQ
jgi:hypothetical protein